jgi:WD repeat-containing protein 26
MGEHLDSISSTLSYFTDVGAYLTSYPSIWSPLIITSDLFTLHAGVPTIRFAQKHGAQNLQNLSTVATFFSAVTATTLQFSYTLPTDALGSAVNSFWFASLVFSIASAVNSLLGNCR